MQPVPKVRIASPYKNCPFCGEQILSVAIKCKHCQSMLDNIVAGVADPGPASEALIPKVKTKTSDKSRGIYIILGLFLGFFGVHNFYRGNPEVGIVELLVSCLLFVAEMFLPENLILIFVFGLYAVIILCETLFATMDGAGAKMRM